MSDGKTELDRIGDRYARRARVPAGRYSRFRPEVLAGAQERQRALVALLRAGGQGSLEERRILEVGCGSGANLLELMLLGADPARLVGNELLPARLAQARRVLPPEVELHGGDASALPFAEASFDIVYQSTVFSSILDDALQVRIADAMWRWVRPGGGILWYDFTFDNPANRDVRGVPIRRVKELFPGARVTSRRVTLAPPISRRVVRIHPVLYDVFNLLPLLRSHLICWVEKP